MYYLKLSEKNKNIILIKNNNETSILELSIDPNTTNSEINMSLDDNFMIINKKGGKKWKR